MHIKIMLFNFISWILNILPQVRILTPIQIEHSSISAEKTKFRALFRPNVSKRSLFWLNVKNSLSGSPNLHWSLQKYFGMFEKSEIWKIRYARSGLTDTGRATASASEDMFIRNPHVIRNPHCFRDFWADQDLAHQAPRTDWLKTRKLLCRAPQY